MNFSEKLNQNATNSESISTTLRDQPDQEVIDIPTAPGVCVEENIDGKLINTEDHKPNSNNESNKSLENSLKNTRSENEDITTKTQDENEKQLESEKVFSKLLFENLPRAMLKLKSTSHYDQSRLGLTSSKSVSVDVKNRSGKTMGSQTTCRPLRTSGVQANNPKILDDSKSINGRKIINQRNVKSSNIQSNMIVNKQSQNFKYNETKRLESSEAEAARSKMYENRSKMNENVESKKHIMKTPSIKRNSLIDAAYLIKSSELAAKLDKKTNSLTRESDKKSKPVSRLLDRFNSQKLLYITDAYETKGRPSTVQNLGKLGLSRENQSRDSKDLTRPQRSLHKSRLSARRQPRIPERPQPQVDTEELVFLREKIMAQEYDHQKSRFLGTRSRFQHHVMSRKSGTTFISKLIPQELKNDKKLDNTNDRIKSILPKAPQSQSKTQTKPTSKRRHKIRSRSLSPAGNADGNNAGNLVTSGKHIIGAVNISTEFTKLLLSKMPIIWNFGFDQISIAKNVQDVLELIQRRHDFHEIDLDEEISKWKSTPGFVKYSESSEEPKDFYDAIIYRASKLLRKEGSTDFKSLVSLSSGEICQLLKLALVTAQVDINPKGYIIKNFPVTTQEGSEFEIFFYPCTAGLYFLNNHWSKNRTLPPDVIQSKNFLRTHNYSEYEVEKAADHFGAKTIKVSNTEDLLGQRIQDLLLLVQFHIEGRSQVMKSLSDHQSKPRAAKSSRKHSRRLPRR